MNMCRTMHSIGKPRVGALASLGNAFQTSVNMTHVMSPGMQMCKKTVEQSFAASSFQAHIDQCCSASGFRVKPPALPRANFKRCHVRPTQPSHNTPSAAPLCLTSIPPPSPSLSPPSLCRSLCSPSLHHPHIHTHVKVIGERGIEGSSIYVKCSVGKCFLGRRKSVCYLSGSYELGQVAFQNRQGEGRGKADGIIPGPASLAPHLSHRQQLMRCQRVSGRCKPCTCTI